MSEPEEFPDDPATAVAVAYVHTDAVDYNFFHSYTQLLARDLAEAGRVWRGGPVAMYGGTDGLAHSRNTAVRDFLADNKAAWLFWVDTDMGFAPDTVERLYACADPETRPIVGALCFAAMHEEPDGAGGWRDLYTPVLMDWVHTDDSTGFKVRWDYPKDSLVRCDGTGSACILIHRSVFERIRDSYGPDWTSWYSRVVNPATGQLVSEDLSFCLRLLQAGIPIHVDTSVQTTHAKRLWLSQDDYWRQRALNPPPPVEARRDWTVPRCAIIPTHNRPALLRALVWSLGSQCDHIVVLDNASDPPVDEAELGKAAGRARVEVIRDEEQPPNLARFWNAMFERCGSFATVTNPRWDVAVLNDDSVVPAGWYDACATALRQHPTAVIAHTDPTTPQLLTELHNVGGNRMCPHAFVIRGETGLRADESMMWWYFDSDLDQRARRAGGVLSVRGPRVINSQANTTTTGVLAEQAERDRKAFEAKWSR